MDLVGVKAIEIPEGDVKSLAIDGVTVWRKPSPYTLIDYVYFDGTAGLELPIIMEGSDTARLGFTIWGTQGNLFGYYSGSAAGTNQYSVYTSSNSSYVRYDGGLARGWGVASKTKDYDLVMTPTGYTDGQGYSDTWTAKTFTGGAAMLGALPNSTSAKAKFKCYYCKVDGKIDLRPAKRNADGVVGMLDTMTGTFYTGAYMHETAPNTLMMGGNPNTPEPEPDE